ncbi:MAG: hypothetical protein BM564_01015 [Bacteroidetes bacterium MedPE-SWsnd-G2]|nr:MAG: hypothetical protein BM564_01015 [Bacteroidetes bacterium MedPE-SWsnd-G2]
MSIPVKIINYSPVAMVGCSVSMSYENNKTFELWKSFMSRKKELTNTIGPNLYSIQDYPESFLKSGFNPEVYFTKWACIEVEANSNIPEGFKAFNFHGGLYAVFSHKGDHQKFIENWQWILNWWLPQSNYKLDQRVHFEILGPKYKNNSHDSEEKICIPIVPRID